MKRIVYPILIERESFMNNGGVILTSLSNLKSYSYDRAYFIVRSNNLSSASLRALKLEPYRVLSPSKELFHQYLDLKAKKNWNQKTFNEEYLPVFIREMVIGCQEENADQKTNALNEIYRRVKTGETVALVCYCKNLCHRYIVGGLLQGVGLDVVLDDESVDISQYYSMYLKEKERVTATYANAR